MTLDNLKFLALTAKVKTGLFLDDERGEVNIVAMVVLMGIAVILAVVFKDKVEGLLDKLFEALESEATKAIQDKN